MTSEKIIFHKSENHIASSEVSPVKENTPDFGERYEVIAKIGQGASAAVYKIKDKVLDQTFAAKVMHAELLADDNARQRFTQEAEAAHSLTHANLVAVYGHGMTDNQSPYIVMDCLDGQTLAQVLRAEKHLDRDRAISISVQVCEALVHMHLKGIAHRDIKPSNIFLSEKENGMEFVKVVDFGIAKIQMSEDCTRLTQTGEILGSPLYMSPEQCRGEKLDFRSDIYSLGCVMYEMLTGVSPFAANNPVKTILKHISGKIPLFKEVAADKQIPVALQSMIMKCLQTDPALRYQVVDELLNDLILFRDGGRLNAVVIKITPPVWKRTAVAIIDWGIIAGLYLGIIYLTCLAVHVPFTEICMLKLSSVYCLLLLLLAYWFLISLVVTPIINALILIPFAYVILKTVLPFPLVLVGTFILLSCGYFTILESSVFQATLGKKLFGICVVDYDGRRLSFIHALEKSLSKIFLPYLFLIEQSFPVASVRNDSFLRKLKLRGGILIHLLQNPPTDKWTSARLINAKVLNKPFLLDLKGYCRVRKEDLNEVHIKLKAVRKKLIIQTVILLPGAYIICPAYLSRALSHPTSHTCAYLVTLIILFYLPLILYYIHLNRIKEELLSKRKSIVSIIEQPQL